MTVLNWIKAADNAVIAFDTNIHVGSRIRVRGTHYPSGQTPASFRVFRGYGRLAQKFLQRTGRPLQTLVAELDVEESLTTSTVALSEQFVVASPRRRLRVPLFADDSVGARTHPRPIYAARLGSINIAPNIVILGNGGSIGGAEVTTSVDPELELRVLLPWQTSDDLFPPQLTDYDTVQDVIDDIALDLAEWTRGVDYESARSSILEDIGWALPRDPLEGWSVQLSTQTMYLGDGETAAIHIEFDTPTPGTAAFAIQARGALPDGEVETVVSEILAVEVGPDPEQVSLALP